MTRLITPGFFIEFSIPITSYRNRWHVALLTYDNYIVRTILSNFQPHWIWVYCVTFALAYTCASSSWVRTAESELIRQRIQIDLPMIFQHITQTALHFLNTVRVKVFTKVANRFFLENSGSMYMQLLLKHLRSRRGCSVIIYYSVILYYEAYCNERYHSLRLMYSIEEQYSWLRTNGSQISSLITRWRHCAHLVALAATS